MRISAIAGILLSSGVAPASENTPNLFIANDSPEAVMSRARLALSERYLMEQARIRLTLRLIELRDMQRARSALAIGLTDPEAMRPGCDFSSAPASDAPGQTAPLKIISSSPTDEATQLATLTHYPFPEPDC